MSDCRPDAKRPLSLLDAADPRRAEFEWLNRLSTALLLFNVTGGLVLLAWETRN